MSGWSTTAFVHNVRYVLLQLVKCAHPDGTEVVRLPHRGVRKPAQQHHDGRVRCREDGKTGGMRGDDAGTRARVDPETLLETKHERHEQHDDQGTAQLPDERLPSGDFGAHPDARVQALIDPHEDPARNVDQPGRNRPKIGPAAFPDGKRAGGCIAGHARTLTYATLRGTGAGGRAPLAESVSPNSGRRTVTRRIAS